MNNYNIPKKTIHTTYNTPGMFYHNKTFSSHYYPFTPENILSIPPPTHPSHPSHSSSMKYTFTNTPTNVFQQDIYIPTMVTSTFPSCNIPPPPNLLSTTDESNIWDNYRINKDYYNNSEMKKQSSPSPPPKPPTPPPSTQPIQPTQSSQPTQRYNNDGNKNLSRNTSENKSYNQPNNYSYNKRSNVFLSSFNKSDKPSYSSYYCNNCGKSGHGFYQCKNPITSYGVIIFRHVKNHVSNKKERQYLMIRRRDTISYVDYMRGKYSLFNRKYIKSLVKDMTDHEQEQIMSQPFDTLWYELWKNNEPTPNDKPRDSFVTSNNNSWKKTPNVVLSQKPRKEDIKEDAKEDINENNDPTETPHLADTNEPISPKSIDIKNTYEYFSNKHDKFSTREKFDILQKGKTIVDKPHFTISEIIEEIRKDRELTTSEGWKEPEWGFCKGRRNYKESDYDCALREMEEETGYLKENMDIIKNISTFEEIFIGSNFKCYKHKYYLMYMTYENSLKTGDFEKSEVSSIKWASFNESLSLIRSYNIEKKRMITDVEHALNKYSVFENC